MLISFSYLTFLISDGGVFMEIHVSQLVPGCILTKDVTGKTNYPIISKDTVLTKEHISVLKKFLISKVEVSRTLANGRKFKAKAANIEPINEYQTSVSNDKKLSFHEYYDHALMKYKDHFNQWQNNIPINIPEVRKFLLPLIESSLNDEAIVFKLHQYTTKEDYLYHHSLAMSLLSSFLARKMGYEKGESIQVGLAGFLSDAGMAKVDPQIITKDSSLMYKEHEEIKKHPSYSYLLVQPINILTDAVKLAVVQHHERLDGSGYPLGLMDDKIHQYTRIIALCDTYHAMTSERLYQQNQSPFKVMDELRKNQFTKFDAQVVQTFIQGFMNLSLGEKVKLSNHQVGKITYIEIENLTTPLILLEDSEEVISLKDQKTLSIIDFV